MSEVKSKHLQAAQHFKKKKVPRCRGQFWLSKSHVVGIESGVKCW